MTFERFGRWLDTENPQPRWLMIVLWAAVVFNAVHSVFFMVDALS